MNRTALLIGIIAGASAVALWYRRHARQVAGGRSWRPSDLVTEASDESFPASDPPARTATVGSTIGEGLA